MTRATDVKALRDYAMDRKRRVSVAEVIALQMRIEPHVGKKEGRGRMWLKWASAYNDHMVCPLRFLFRVPGRS